MLVFGTGPVSVLCLGNLRMMPKKKEPKGRDEWCVCVLKKEGERGRKSEQHCYAYASAFETRPAAVYALIYKCIDESACH